MEEKYIDLLLNKCLNFDKSNILFISYDIVNKDFVDLVCKKAKNMNLEVILDPEDINVTKDKLLKLTKEEIEKDSYFDKSKWDKYAKLNASFLILDTEFPGVLDDIDPSKIAHASFVKRKSRPVFRKKETNNEIPWVIAALPNEIWASNIFNSADAYEKLKNAIYKICMVDKDNPAKSWEDYLKDLKKISNKLNDLKIKKLHYLNSLGTDLYVSLPDEVIWTSIADDLELNMIVNMPSYEVFTSPNYKKTSGIVYSSKPLVYGGATIKNFYLKFSEGKVVDFDAEEGYEVLKKIIESDSNSCYLGEIALVNYNSPISDMGIVFGTTLIDENASCHLALGDGFSTSIPNGTNMFKDELLSNNINQSDNHVDFMIGTSDLKIEAETIDGIITIFDNGNFLI